MRVYLELPGSDTWASLEVMPVSRLSKRLTQTMPFRSSKAVWTSQLYSPNPGFRDGPLAAAVRQPLSAQTLQPFANHHDAARTDRPSLTGVLEISPGIVSACARSLPIAPGQCMGCSASTALPWKVATIALARRPELGHDDIASPPRRDAAQTQEQPARTGNAIEL